MLPLKPLRSRNESLADLLPWAAVIEDGIILGKNGELIACWAYRGQDLATSSDDELAAGSARLNNVLRRFGSGWMLHSDLIRVPVGDYPDSVWDNPTLELIDRERRGFFEQNGNSYESVYVMTLTYTPPLATEIRGREIFFDRDQEDKLDPKTIGSQALAHFKNVIRDIEDGLRALFFIERLGAEKLDNGLVLDRQLQHLLYCVRGDRQPFRLPPIPMYLDAMLSADVVAGLTPMVNNKHTRLVAIDGYPVESHPEILAVLDNLAIEYRWSNRFIFLEPFQARRILERYRRKWRQKVRGFWDQLFQTSRGTKNLDAEEMTTDAEKAIGEGEGGRVRYGFFTSVIVLMHEDRSVVDEWERLVKGTIQNIGFGARSEQVNAFEAYLGTLPGHGLPNLRRQLLHTLLFSDLVPASSVWAGEQHNSCSYYPKQSPPLAIVNTGGATPFRLNLHVDDVGHTLILGPTGAGKSTILGLICAQFFRYENAQLFVFEKGRSNLPLTYAAGGSHYEPGADDSGLQFCPLQELNTQSDLTWATNFIETLVALQGETVTADDREQIYRAVRLLSEGEGRSLTDFVATLQNQRLRTALKPYTLEGPLGSLLDAERDSLSLDRYVTFEMEDLMALGPKNAAPVLLYLFRQIERRLSGAPTLIVLDEAWLMLGLEMFRDRIREWLKGVRKLNAAVVIATQSVSDAASSPIYDVIAESCLTRIFLPNAEAGNDSSRALYSGLGLTDNQIDILRLATPKREYLYTSPKGRRLFDLRLGPAALAFFGTTGAEDLKAVRACMEQHGDDWPGAWLEQLGHPELRQQWERYAYEDEEVAA